ncbi:MAG: RDD family protein [Chitinophagaceae bacterium]|nr:RDD family protein [Chitinophagaceae bacterium]
MSTVPIHTPFNIALDFELAPFHKRLFASLLDLLIVILYSNGMKFLLYKLFAVSDTYALPAELIFVTTPVFFYHLIFEIAFHGQSIGKKAMGIRVMNLEGGDPTLSQYLIRWFFRFWEWPLIFSIVWPEFWVIFQLFTVGVQGIFVVIVIAVTNKSQRLGDLAAGTVVVSTKIESSIHDTIFMEVSAKNYEVMFPGVMKLSDRDINTIKTVLNDLYKTQRYETAHRIAGRIKSVLNIQTDMEVDLFLERLIADYNYLATKE